MVWDRRSRILRFIEPSSQRGLEFGALDRPTISRSEGEVYYVDHLATAQLKEKYRGVPGYDTDRIIDVDFTWSDIRLQDIVGHKGPFDYVIASHMIEHVPDMIGWFNEVCEVLSPSGLISLVIPDRRYTFDFFRPETSISDLIACHLEKLKKPSARQIVEHYFLHASVDAVALWRDPFASGSITRVHDDAFSMRKCREVISSNEYHDVHCSVFTPASFYQVTTMLRKLNLIECDIEAIFPTQPLEIDFFVSLRRA
jgi:hypothetical protein